MLQTSKRPPNRPSRASNWQRKAALRPPGYHNRVDITGWESMYRSGERGAEDAPTPLLRELLPQLPPGHAPI